MVSLKIVSEPSASSMTLLFNDAGITPVFAHQLYTLLPRHAALVNDIFDDLQYQSMIRKTNALLGLGVKPGSSFNFFQRMGFGVSVLSIHDEQNILGDDILGFNILFHEDDPGFMNIRIAECYADPLSVAGQTEQKPKGVALFTVAQACGYFFQLYPSADPHKVAIRLHAVKKAYDHGTYHRCGFVDSPECWQNNITDEYAMHLTVRAARDYTRWYQGVLKEKIKVQTISLLK